MVKKEVTKEDICKEYDAKLLSGTTNDEYATKLANFIYESAACALPKNIHIVDSPTQAHKIIAKLKVEYGLIESEESYVPDTPSARGGIYDFQWVAFYDLETRNGRVNLEKFNTYLDLINKACIHELYLYSENCVIVRKPLKFSITERAIGGFVRVVRHCEEGPAVEWADGTKEYYWHNNPVPEKLIMTPEKITLSDIRALNGNLEMLRIYREALGALRYYNILGSELEVIDRDYEIVNNGKQEVKRELVLYSTKLNDAAIDAKVLFLHVICPSTGREYDIYPPNQKSTNVWEAKWSTFSGRVPHYRQGDVAFEIVGQSTDKPIIET